LNKIVHEKINTGKPIKNILYWQGNTTGQCTSL